MTALAPVVSRDEALRRLTRHGWWSIFARAPRETHLELVYLPRYQIALVPAVTQGSELDAEVTASANIQREPERALLGKPAVAPSAPGGVGAAAFVGAYEADVDIFDLAGVQYADREPDELFAPALSAAEALHAARLRVQRAALAVTRPHERLALAEPPQIELVYYPYWAYYFRRWVGMLDAALLDAVTGSRAGPQLKRALLAALAASRGVGRST
jgi:hypothetical protein